MHSFQSSDFNNSLFISHASNIAMQSRVQDFFFNLNHFFFFFFFFFLIFILPEMILGFFWNCPGYHLCKTTITKNHESFFRTKLCTHIHCVWGCKTCEIGERCVFLAMFTNIGRTWIYQGITWTNLKLGSALTLNYLAKSFF